MVRCICLWTFLRLSIVLSEVDLTTSGAILVVMELQEIVGMRVKILTIALDIGAFYPVALG